MAEALPAAFHEPSHLADVRCMVSLLNRRALTPRPRIDFGMTKFSTVLFDLDGTLIDSIRLILDSYHHTLAVHNLPPRDDAEWLAGVGTPLSVQFADWADDETMMAKLVATYREYNLTHHDDRISAYPGVVETVTALHHSRVRIGVVTSKNSSGARRGLKVIGLADVVPVIIGADDVTRPKPDPEPVLAALERLGAAAADTVFVGDSLHDMYSGREAGVATAAALWGPFNQSHLEPAAPTHWLSHPRELLSLVGVA